MSRRSDERLKVARVMTVIVVRRKQDNRKELWSHSTQLGLFSWGKFRRGCGGRGACQPCLIIAQFSY